MEVVKKVLTVVDCGHMVIKIISYSSQFVLLLFASYTEHCGITHPASEAPDIEATVTLQYIIFKAYCTSSKI